MKILIYGAGVIGSLYAVLFSKNKNTDVSVYTRGKRLEELGENGLRYGITLSSSERNCCIR